MKHLAPTISTVNTRTQVLVDSKTYQVISVRNGGMGRVWLLEQAFEEPSDPIYRRRIAVKTFDFMADQDAIERELNIWISLEHPSVVPLKKIGRLNYRLAAIMPLLDGSLEDVIERAGSLSELQVAATIVEIAEGLQYAWTTFSLLHLDLKPSNVLVHARQPLRTKIADWGISRLAGGGKNASYRADAGGIESQDSRTAYGAGTPLFMAPERFSGDWVISPVADIYSLGMMAVQLHTGILPFKFGQTDPVNEILTGSCVRNAAQLLAQRGKAFGNLCLACIEPDPAARPRSFAEIIAGFRSLASAHRSP